MSKYSRPAISRSARRVAASAIAAMLLASGCDVSQMSFVKDDRVRVVHPEDRSTVTLPLVLRWQVHDFEVTGRDGQAKPNAGYFAVFIDRPPIPPGKTLEWFVKQDDSCGGDPCGTIEKLAGVYTTKNTHLELTRLHSTGGQRDKEQHEAILVLMDGKGARIGESASRVQFNFERKA